MKLWIGLPVLFTACALATAEPGRIHAAAISYTLKDLGVAYNNSQPGEGGFEAPQISNSGAITYAPSGQVSVGGYSVQKDANQYIQYSSPASSPIELKVGVYGAGQNHDFDVATGINATGTAIGFQKTFAGTSSDNESTSAAFVYRPGGPTGPSQLPGLSVVPGVVPGTVAWFALGINASNMIVGQAPDSTTARLAWSGLFNSGAFGMGPPGRAFISDGVTSVDLNTLIGPGSGLILTAATSINDLGQIVGYGYSTTDPNGSIHTFLLTPSSTPEPGAWALGLATLGYLGGRRLVARAGSRNCGARA